MALTKTPLQDTITYKGPSVGLGDRKVWFGTITFDSSYPTGGELLVPADFGFDVQVDAVISLGSQLGNRYVAWDPSTDKLRLYTALGTEAGNTTDQSTIVVAVMVIGR